MAQLGRGQPVPAVISRGSLADPPVLTTQPPKVIQAAATPGYGRPGAPLISAAPLIAAAAPAASTPQPIIIAAAVKLAASQPPVILRGTLADPPVLTTPRPVVIAQPVRWPPTFPLISSAPLIIPPPPVTYGTARQGVMTIPAATAGDSTLTAARAVAGQMPLPHAEGGKQ